MPGPVLLALGERVPQIDPEAFVAPGATIVGDVSIGARASVWYGTVVRADTERVQVGQESNLQDGCVLHADPGAPLTIGDRVTVGHRVVLHGATVESDVLIGMGSVVMNHAHIGTGSIIGAGAIVTQGTVVPPESLVLGAPARVIRPIRDEERAQIARGAAGYVTRAAEHRGTTPLT